MYLRLDGIQFWAILVSILNRLGKTEKERMLPSFSSITDSLQVITVFEP